jgi:hypothetical protein
MSRRATVSEQFDLFGAPPAPSCPHHDAHHVCEFEGLDTSGTGFVHPQLCKGRIPLRRCHGCGELRSPGRWNHRDYWRCIECQPLGTMGECPPLANALSKKSEITP